MTFRFFCDVQMQVDLCELYSCCYNGLGVCGFW